MDAISAITPPKGLADVDVFRDQRGKLAYKSFEAMFVQVMLKEMRKTVPGEGIFPRTQATETFEEMLDAAFAQIVAESGQLGIAERLQAEAELAEAGGRLTLEQELELASLEALKTLPSFADNP
jgi:flagellar protein FlgJ